MRAFILAGLLMWVATCGQKGPLQLPERQISIVVGQELDPSTAKSQLPGKAYSRAEVQTHVH